jgi:hypothetical protein
LMNSMTRKGMGSYSPLKEKLLLIPLLLIWFCIGRYNDKMAYGQSKLANILHAKELSRRLRVSFSTNFWPFLFNFYAVEWILKT